eukprot:TRINITY_DN260_c0_g1_i1.p1 TRINITY_DN260_c0_g1~~TRINITY_DN260_c0_g1_i1.p1  ORF type:complete len:420 (-),score=57.50 TRINITY_DN260_c0_g1_i1:30-1229(-)
MQSGYMIDIPEPKAKTRNLIGFFIFGLINNFAYVVFLSAAVDIMENKLTSSVVLLCEILPGMIVQAIAPLFMQKIPFWLKVCFCSITSCSSFLLVALPNTLELRLIGVVVASVATGFGEITYMSLTSFYHKNTVSAYSSGTGGAGVFGSVLYWSLRNFASQYISPKFILLSCAPIPLYMAISYFCIISGEQKSYHAIQTGYLDDDQKQFTGARELSLSEKFKLQLRLFKYTGPLFLVYYSEYTIMQAVAPVIIFPNSKYWADGSVVYTWYQMLYQVGVLISRSSVNIIQFKRLWFLSSWQVVNLIVLWSVAYFEWIESIYIIFPIIVYEGLVGGAVYVNCFYLLTEEIEDDIKEFAMSCVSFWYSCGILSASLSGLVIQPWLEKRRRKLYFKPLTPNPK